MSEQNDSKYATGGFIPPGEKTLINTLGEPELVLSAGQWAELHHVDDDRLPTDGPNVSTSQGDYDHQNHIGEPCDDDEAADVQRLLADPGPDGGW